MEKPLRLLLLVIICQFRWEAVRGSEDATVGEVMSNECSLEFVGLMVLGDRSLVSLREPAEGSTFWIELGKSKYGIAVEEVGGEGEWVRVSTAGGSGVIDFAKPKIIDPLTLKRMNTLSGVSKMSVQDLIEEEQRADRVEMDLLVNYLKRRERR